MTTYITRRLLLGLITIILITIIVFLVMRLLPGDPLVLYLSAGEIGTLNEQQLWELREKYGLNDILPVQYINWVGNLAQGDFGLSIFYDDSVSTLIKQRIPITLHLGIAAFIFGNALGIFAGVICAMRRGKWIDTIITFLANIGITMPGFLAGIFLIFLFSLTLGWFPTGGYTSPFTDFWLSTKQLLMPVFCMSLFTIAAQCRQARSSMLEVIQQDYIRTAWAKGLSERLITTRHALKNALIPVITIMGLQVSLIFGGSVLIETIFNIPGIGRLMASSMLQQDFMVVQAVVLLLGIAVVLANLTVDISYGWLEPRIRFD
ncbi:MAG TPA: ABC transporter permease [Dehalococcoidales bacterium]|nr:ABC transporter permease [Dehalococcoidales bacterium]